MKTACFFEMLVSTYKPTLRYNPEDQQWWNKFMFQSISLGFHLNISS
jgi:hypothetical protein